MSVQGIERVQRAARARAVAASIVDSPRLPRRFHVPPDADLRPSDRRRSHAPRGLALPRLAPTSLHSRRAIAAAVVCVQLGVLAALFVLPVFKAEHIVINGTHLLSRSAVLDTAGINSSQSIFTVDGAAVRSRLLQQPWVRSATVDTELPSTVRITVTEWAPILRLHDAGGDHLVAPGGASVALSAVAGPPPLPLLIDRRAQPAPLDPLLARTLAATAQVFPSATGTGVDHFEFQADGRLAIVAAPGWRAILGHVDTAAAVAAIPTQFGALSALRAKLDFTKPGFGYIDLTDPSAPAAGGLPPPAAPRPAPVPAAAGRAPAPAAAAPQPTTAPTPPPAPTPTPAPTPFQLNAGPPSKP